MRPDPVKEPMTTCGKCGRDDIIQKAGRLAVHFAKVEDSKPCPGSWPGAKKRTLDDQVKGEFKRPTADQVFEDWPDIGEHLHDVVGRTLRVTEVHPVHPQERNVVGVLGDGNDYACDARTLMTIWRRSIE